MAYPLLAKPLAGDNTGGKSHHTLLLLRDASDLRTLLARRLQRDGDGDDDEAGFVIEEFTSHSGVVVKAYSVGPNLCVCDARASFADLEEDSDGTLRFAGPFPDRSGEEGGNGDRDGDRDREGARLIELRSVSGGQSEAGAGHGHGGEAPEKRLEEATGLGHNDVRSMAEAVCDYCRKRLHLSMFNIDLAFQVTGSGEVTVFALDVNYMPGYHKLGRYTEIFGSFLGGLRATNRDETRRDG